MNDENKKLLDEVIEKRLDQVLKSPDANSEETTLMFEQAMKAIDRRTELSKMEASYDEQVKKQELATAEAKKDRIIRCIEIGAALMAGPVIQYCCNLGYAKLMCNFEKDYTFTTSAGKSLSRLFQFKHKN